MNVEEQLRRIITQLGYEVIDGDFVLRDGSRGTVFVRPRNAERILRSAMQALQAADGP